ncbi:hypothetical protein ACFVMC_14040 [Nocardia sp. NPDC127579]|uniref:hypothetical protein n=1 Tax=Nocardia sp. NPDC127579 TaxID=3345402 RepID=UPI003639F20D
MSAPASARAHQLAGEGHAAVALLVLDPKFACFADLRVEYRQFLAAVLEQSGLTATALARASHGKLSDSTIHNYTKDPAYKYLPTKPRVMAFLQGCGLSAEDLRIGLDRWQSIQDRRAAETAGTVGATSQPPPDPTPKSMVERALAALAALEVPISAAAVEFLRTAAADAALDPEIAAFRRDNAALLKPPLTCTFPHRRVAEEDRPPEPEPPPEPVASAPESAAQSSQPEAMALRVDSMPVTQARRPRWRYSVATAVFSAALLTMLLTLHVVHEIHERVQAVAESVLSVPAMYAVGVLSVMVVLVARGVLPMPGHRAEWARLRSWPPLLVFTTVPLGVAWAVSYHFTGEMPAALIAIVMLVTLLYTAWWVATVDVAGLRKLSECARGLVALCLTLCVTAGAAVGVVLAVVEFGHHRVPLPTASCAGMLVVATGLHLLGAAGAEMLDHLHRAAAAPRIARPQPPARDQPRAAAVATRVRRAHALPQRPSRWKMMWLLRRWQRGLAIEARPLSLAVPGLTAPEVPASSGVAELIRYARSGIGRGLGPYTPIIRLRSPGELAAAVALSRLGERCLLSAIVVRDAFAEIGIALPGNTFEQSLAGDPVSLDMIEIGDLIVSSDHRVSGLYVGQDVIVTVRTDREPRVDLVGFERHEPLEGRFTVRRLARWECPATDIVRGRTLLGNAPRNAEAGPRRASSNAGVLIGRATPPRSDTSPKPQGEAARASGGATAPAPQKNFVARSAATLRHFITPGTAEKRSVPEAGAEHTPVEVQDDLRALERDSPRPADTSPDEVPFTAVVGREHIVRPESMAHTQPMPAVDATAGVPVAPTSRSRSRQARRLEPGARQISVAELVAKHGQGPSQGRRKHHRRPPTSESTTERPGK